MDTFARLHTCGHLYRARGFAEAELDPAPFIAGRTVIETRDLPGFIDHDRNVTYESHHFRVYVLGRAATTDKPARIDGVIVTVHHAAGWEVWEARHKLAVALARCTDPRGLFFLCWGLMDMAHDKVQRGKAEATETMRAAFVEGRLRKRRLPSGGTKVWIEPPQAGVPLAGTG